MVVEMLRIVADEDRIKHLEEAYNQALGGDPEVAEELRVALRQARQGRPAAQRLYDLQRRVSRALQRFEGVRTVGGKRAGKVVRLPKRDNVTFLPGATPRIGA